MRQKLTQNGEETQLKIRIQYSNTSIERMKKIDNPDESYLAVYDFTTTENHEY